MPYKNNRNGRDDKSFKTDRSGSFDRSERQSRDNKGSFNKFSRNSKSQEGDKFQGNREGRPSRFSDSKPRGERPEQRKRESDSDFQNKRPRNSFNKRSDSFGDNEKRGSFKKEFSADKSFSDRRQDRRERPAQGADRSGKPFEKRSRPFGEEKRSSGFNPNFRPKRNDRSGERKWTHEEQLDNQPRLRPRKVQEPKNDDLIRLNRYIANAGICSRRKADELIEAGVISVNGVVISELGHKVNPQTDEIRYNGSTLRREKMVYVLLNKPKDYITTTDDPQERRTVMQLVEKASKERIYPVGRLDRNTTGLLLMTNDGDLAEKLSHPRNNITKIYQVELSKSLSQGDLNKIEFGLELEDGFVKPDVVSYVQGGSKREIGVQIHSGKNRIVRRIFEHLGYEVVKLDRVVYANLTKKDLPRGRWRYLDEKEIIQLKHFIK